MAALAVLLSPKVAICWLSLAICDIASLALLTASEMPNSAAQRLDAVAGGVETLRQLLRRTDDRAARRAVVRARRQRLQRIGKAVVDRFERAGGAGIAVDALQPAVELRAQVGVGGAGILYAQLFL